MARITLRQLLDHAAENDYGLPAFNINNMEQGLAIMEAAEAVNAPVIIQASRGARTYANDIVLAKLIDALAELYPHIPVCMHQDHGNGPATCATAIQYGFTSVMMDGSLMEDGKTPADYDYNVDVTRRVVEMAHSCGVSVEGELGVLGSLETGMGEAEDGHGFEGKLDHADLLTDPGPGRRLRAARTEVDALAIAMGTSHGAYKFTPQAGRRRPGHERDRGNPPPPAQHPPGDARLVHRCRRTCRTSSTSTAARCPRPGACRSRRSSAASSTACARSTSTPTTAWPSPARSARCWPRSPASSTRAPI